MIIANNRHYRLASEKHNFQMKAPRLGGVTVVQLIAYYWVNRARHYPIGSTKLARPIAVDVTSMKISDRSM